MALRTTTSPPRQRPQGSPRTALGRRCVVLAVLAALLGAGAPVGAPAAAQSGDGLSGDTYASDEFGWSVEFDDDVWEAEEIDERGSAGVQLSAPSNRVFANLAVYDDGITDADACLDDLERAFANSDDWDDVEPARGLDAPETADDVVGAVLTGTLALEEGTVDLALYLECREVDDATLTVTVTAVEEAYEDNLPLLEELLAGIETGGSSTGDDPQPDDPAPDDPAPDDPDPESDDGPSSTDPVSRDDDPAPEDEDPTPDSDEPSPDTDDPDADDPDADDPDELTPENDPPVLGHDEEDRLGQGEDGTLDDGAYRSGLGYGLTWDPDALEGEAADDPGAGVRLEDPDTGATFEVAAFEDPSIDDCIDTEVGRVLGSPDYAFAAGSDGIRPPTSSDDAAGRVIRATEDTPQQARKIIYVECRPLADEGEGGDPVFLVVRAVSDDEDFRASRTLFETLLAAITVGDEPTEEPTEESTEESEDPTEEPEEEPTPRPRRTPTPEPDEDAATEDLGETDLDGGVFVSDQFPFRVEWSTAVWEVEPLDEGIQEGITIVAESGAFGRIVTADTPAPYGIDACLLDNVEQWAAASPDYTDFTPPAGQEIDWPEGTLAAYGIGTLTLDDGTEVPLVSAAGCIELGETEDYLVMSLQTFEPVYAENAAAFNEVVATIEIGETSGDQQASLPPTHLRAGAVGGDAVRPKSSALPR